MTELFYAFIKVFFDKKYYLLVYKGIVATLSITAIAIVISLIVGIVLVAMQILRFSVKYKFLEKLFNFLAKIYIDVIRGTPVIVQLTFIWIVVFGQINLSKIIVGGIAFGLNSSAYMAELIRAGIMALDRGQTEASFALGLTKLQSLKHIVLPQACRVMLPGLVNEFITLIKETSIIGVVGEIDIMKAGNIMISNTGNAVYPLTIVACCYFFLTTLITFFLKKFEIRLNKRFD